MNQLIDEKVGLLELLSTTDKSTVVGAVNEVSDTIKNRLNGKEIKNGTILDFVSNAKNNEIGFIASTYYPSDIPVAAEGFVLVLVDESTARRKCIFYPYVSEIHEIYMKDFFGTNWTSTEWIKIVTSKNMCNPNLLINSDFKINQRGQTSYTGNNIYTVDRWRTYGNSNVTISPSGNGIDIVTTGSGWLIMQQIEKWDYLKGKTVTLSVNVSNVVCEKGESFTCKIETWYGAFGFTFTEDGIHSASVVIPPQATAIIFFISYSGNHASLTVNWAKLELGSVATQFVPPNPAEELTKCKRFYQRINGNGITVAKKLDDKNFVCYTRFATEMRTIPTIHTIRTVRLYLPETSQVLVSSDKNWVLDCVLSSTGIQWLTIRTSLFTNVPDIAGYVGYIDNSEDILELDAEIY